MDPTAVQCAKQILDFRKRMRPFVDGALDALNMYSTPKTILRTDTIEHIYSNVTFTCGLVDPATTGESSPCVSDDDEEQFSPVQTPRKKRMMNPTVEEISNILIDSSFLDFQLVNNSTFDPTAGMLTIMIQPVKSHMTPQAVSRLLKNDSAVPDIDLSSIEMKYCRGAFSAFLSLLATPIARKFIDLTLERIKSRKLPSWRVYSVRPRMIYPENKSWVGVILRDLPKWMSITELKALIPSGITYHLEDPIVHKESMCALLSCEAIDDAMTICKNLNMLTRNPPDDSDFLSTTIKVFLHHHPVSRFLCILGPFTSVVFQETNSATQTTEETGSQ
jgi:hypothetical protein